MTEIVNPGFSEIPADTTPMIGSAWSRLGAAILDGLITTFTTTALTNYFAGLRPFFPTYGTTLPSIPAWLLPVQGVIVILYFAIFEASKFQATPGKMVLRLYVTDNQGQRLTFGKALLRELIKQVSTVLDIFIPVQLTVVTGLFSLADGITLISNKQRKSIHDFVAGTVVYKKRK